MSPQPSRSVIYSIVALVLMDNAQPPAFAAPAQRSHEATPAAGHRLPTSDHIRAEMTAIRNLVAANHSLITHRRMPRQTALSFAAEVTRHVAALRQAKPDSDAKTALLPLLDAIERGAKAVAGTENGMTQIDGIVEIDEALARYEERFDHPGWKAAREL